MPPYRLLGRLVILLVVCGNVTAQEAGERLCGYCKTSGKVPVEVSKKYADDHDRGETWEVLHCADAIEADDMAMDWKPCARCKTPSVKKKAQQEWNAIEAANMAWLGERRSVDEMLDSKFAHVETTHFIVSWNVPKISINRKSVKMHDAAHLYARRMEELYAKFQGLFGIEDRQNMRNKHWFYVLEKERQALEAGPVYAGLQGSGTVKRAGGASQESVAVMWRDKSEHPGDDDFHRHWIHSAVHQFTSVFYDINWFKTGQKGLSPPWLNDKYGWLDAGLAHWFEMDFDQKCSTFCIREHDAKARWRGGDWRKNIWKAVMAEEAASFPEVISKPTQALSAREHQFVWSWVDYLMARDASAMGKALKMTKMEASTRDILKECWGISTIGFESGWAEWVASEYAPSSKEGRGNPRNQLPNLPATGGRTGR